VVVPLVGPSGEWKAVARLSAGVLVHLMGAEVQVTGAGAQVAAVVAEDPSQNQYFEGRGDCRSHPH
jgi:hypothetical protein